MSQRFGLCRATVRFNSSQLALATAVINGQYPAETLVGLGALTATVKFEENWQQLINFVQSGLFGLSAGSVTLVPAIPDLTGTSVKAIVNVWGTQDVAAWSGLAGPRQTIGGVPAINVEIQGADHFDYMRRPDETDPVKKNFNERVSKFVAELILASKNEQDIKAYLSRQGAVEINGIWRYTP